MPVYKVNVKWAKEKFNDIELNTDEPPLVFKAQLFALSGVQPERQKLMIKGAVIKDDDWGTIKLKDGIALLLMGSAEALPPEPSDKPVFMEDMSEHQLASALDMPAGLTNLGNTCYMNATIQCLRAVPELKEALKRYSGGLTVAGAIAPSDSITAAFRDLNMSMDRTATALPPLIFLQVLHMAFPRFAEKGEGGVYVQQDANEFWVELVRSLQQKLIASSSESGQGPAAAAAAAASFIDQYFGGEFESEMKCAEATDEEVTKSREKFLQLSCFIDQDVKYMQTGLKNRMSENITKNSSALGRDAQYVKTNKIRRIPAYLTIQFVRFHYKEAKAVNAKLLRDVKFPMLLDIFDLCSPELQQKLMPMRDRFKEEDDKQLEKATQGVVSQKDDKKKLKPPPYSFPEDVGSNNSGFYELNAVLTHKGRSSSSGHYVAWVRKKGDDWLMFDDDKVAPCKGEDILKLSGGGDWHCAYVLLYGPRFLEIDDS